MIKLLRDRDSHDESVTMEHMIEAQRRIVNPKGSAIAQNAGTTISDVGIGVPGLD